jgi:hypothetical protein
LTKNHQKRDQRRDATKKNPQILKYEPTTWEMFKYVAQFRLSVKLASAPIHLVWYPKQVVSSPDEQPLNLE